jgi:DNA primase
MLRAARAAKDRELELRVIDMPEGTDPADLVAKEGADAFMRLVDTAATVIEFQIRRVLADSELGTPRGRDRALDEVRPLIATIPERTATRDELVSFVADKLEVPDSYVTTVLSAAPATPRPAQRDGAPRPAQRPLDALARGERTFLAMCLAQGELGREYLAKTTDAHLSSEVLRLVRDHLLSHFDAPLTELPSDDPTIVATITGVVMLADEEPSSESTVRLSFLQLELHRIERELRHAQREDDFDRLDQLLSERETVRQGISHVMGETP